MFVSVKFIVQTIAFCPKADKLRYGKECTIKCSFWKYFVPCLTNSEEVGKMKNTALLKYNPVFLTKIYNNWTAKRDLLNNFDHYIPISNYMKEWLMKYGVKENKITVVHNIIPVDKFKPKDPKNKVPKILFLTSLLESERNVCLLIYPEVRYRQQLF